MTMSKGIVIGSGMAAVEVVTELRKKGYEGQLIMISKDKEVYNVHKPRISIALHSQQGPDDLILHAREEIEKNHGITVRENEKLIKVDAEKKEITTSKGYVESYDFLILATGAHPIKPDWWRDELPLFTMNSWHEFHRFWHASQDMKNVAVVGAGLIGVELAHDLLSADFNVEMCALEEGPLEHLLSKTLSRRVREHLESRGLTYTVDQVMGLQEGPNGIIAEMKSGEVKTYDGIICALGLHFDPKGIHMNEWETDLNINEWGIVVDGSTRTNLKDVYAIGDCSTLGEGVFRYIAPLKKQAVVCAQVIMDQDHMPLNREDLKSPIAIKLPTNPMVSFQPENVHETVSKIYTLEDGHEVEVYFDQDQRLVGFCLSGRKAMMHRGGLMGSMGKEKIDIDKLFK